MKKMVKIKSARILFLLVFIIIISLSAYAEVESPGSEPSGCIYYFFGEGCLGCQEAQGFIGRLSAKYPNLQVKQYEIYLHPDNADLLKQYLLAYNVPEPSQGLPAVFMSESYFIGASPIISLTEDALLENADTACPSLSPGETIGIVGEHFPLDIVRTLSFTRVTKGALYDAFHPGALALLLIFLALLTYIQNKKRLLSGGARFIMGVYTIYFLFSLGLLTWFASTPLNVFFYRSIGFLAVIYGAVILKNFFWSGKILQTSEQTKKRWYEAVDAISSPWGMMIVAIIASLFSFAKVSSTLLSMRFAFRGPSGWLALPITLYYLLIVVMPLIILLIMILLTKQKMHVHAEKKGDKMQTWIKHHHNILNVMVGLLMLILGLIVLFL